MPTITATTSSAAAIAFRLVTLNPGDRIFQRALATAPMTAPTTLAATSITCGNRWTMANWLASAKVETMAATITAGTEPIPPSTSPMGMYPTMFARVSEVPKSKLNGT